MPCNGVTITTAQVNGNLFKHLTSGENQTRLKEWLQTQGATVKVFNGYQSVFVRLGSVDFIIDGEDIRVRSSTRDYDKDAVDKVLGLLQLYSAMLAQSDVIKSFTDMQLEPRDFKTLPGGTVEVRINLSAAPSAPNMIYRETARVQIALDGQMKLITENGAYEVGKKKLDLLLGTLAGQMNVVPSGEYETHRHDNDREQQRLSW